MDGKVDLMHLEELYGKDAQAAYNLLKKLYDEDESVRGDAEFLWRLAKACLLSSNRMDRKNPQKKALILEGRSYASSAYALNEDSFEALRWTAILTGAATEFLGVKEKVEQGKVFKMYLDKALGVDPKEFTLLHLRGRFTFEVANLTWLERKVCSALFSAIPPGTVDEALVDFLEAERNVSFVWPENLLFIARCYALKKQKDCAMQYVQKVEGVPQPDDATKEGLAEVRTLVAKCK